MKKQLLNSVDLEELASALTGSESEESEIIFEEFFNKYDIDEEQFAKLMLDLFEMLDMGVSLITNEVYIGFGTGTVWALKKEITSAFIGGLIQFLLEGGEYDDNGKGFIKTITDEKGKPEYAIVITRPDNKISITKPGDENVEQKKPEE